jgi:hypothetical protein
MVLTWLVRACVLVCSDTYSSLANVEEVLRTAKADKDKHRFTASMLVSQAPSLPA